MRLLYIFISFIVLQGCANEPQYTLIEFKYKPAIKTMVYLEKMPYEGESIRVIDSAVLNFESNQLTFKIPLQEERVFRLRMKDDPQKFYFLNEHPRVIINEQPDANHQYGFLNAPRNTSLKAFLDDQYGKNRNIILAAAMKDSLINNNGTKKNIDSLNESIKIQKQELTAQVKTYIDTTTSPGAFLFLYNRLDLGKDYDGLKQVVVNAGSRFPKHAGIQKLKEQTLKFIKIFEEEYQVGDYLPDVKLPDINNQLTSIHIYKGSFVFLDFWATWCSQCLDPATKRKLMQEFQAKNLKFVSVAIDAEKEAWKRIVQQGELPGVQLIDEDMWRGKTLESLKFDSIPFNFLLDPNGRIVAKAIKPDSLAYTISKILK